jgi:hypothetical protein
MNERDWSTFACPNPNARQISVKEGPPWYCEGCTTILTPKEAPCTHSLTIPFPSSRDCTN